VVSDVIQREVRIGGADQLLILLYNDKDGDQFFWGFDEVIKTT